MFHSVRTMTIAVLALSRTCMYNVRSIIDFKITNSYSILSVFSDVINSNVSKLKTVNQYIKVLNEYYILTCNNVAT